MSYSRVREALPASVTCRCAAGQPPDQPGVDGPDADVGERRAGRQMVEQPAHLGRGEHRVDPQSGPAADQRRRPPGRGPVAAPARRCGRPASRSPGRAARRCCGRQPTTDSRWVDSATADQVEVAGIADRQAPPIAVSTLDQISSASCSTHPGRGCATPTGAEPTATHAAGAVDQHGLACWSCPGRWPRPRVIADSFRTPGRYRLTKRTRCAREYAVSNRYAMSNGDLARGHAPTPRHHQHRRQERGRRPVRDRACAALADVWTSGASSPAHFGTWRSEQSMVDSRDEIDLLLELMGLSGRVTVANGAADRDRRRGRRRWTRRRPVDHRREPAGVGGRPPVRRVPRTVDRHGVGDPARSGDRRPARDGDLDRRGGPR